MLFVLYFIYIYSMFRKLLFSFFSFQFLISVGQVSLYTTSYDYKNLNTSAFIPMSGWNYEAQYYLTILKHSYEMTHINSTLSDTAFNWNGLKGQKTVYTKDGLRMFFIRPDDTISRPCILFTHGNNAKFNSSWSEWLNFYTLDFAMRGFCVAYYENPSSFESQLSAALSARKAFYLGFQCAAAASIYVHHNSVALDIDTSKLFSCGHSYGAYSSLALASADEGINFTDTLFSSFGGFNDRSVYNDAYKKSIIRAISIGGGLFKDDTIDLYNSHMGDFLDEHDAGLALLLLHGRSDNFIQFDLTKMGNPNDSSDYFFAEGPRAIINTIQKKQLPVSTTLWVNCKAGHDFRTSVCGYSTTNCLQQYQWPYLLEPVNLSDTAIYFSKPITDTLLRYYKYMLQQVNDIGYVIGDFIQPALNGNVSSFSGNLYFIEPKDSFNLSKVNGYYRLKNTDCEGNSIIISAVNENKFWDNSVALYPNPAATHLIIDSKEMVQGIHIYTMLGKLVYESSENFFHKELDCSHFANGQYICVIQLKDRIESKKISVIR